MVFRFLFSSFLVSLVMFVWLYLGREDPYEAVALAIFVFVLCMIKPISIYRRKIITPEQRAKIKNAKEAANLEVLKEKLKDL